LRNAAAAGQVNLVTGHAVERRLNGSLIFTTRFLGRRDHGELIAFQRVHQQSILQILGAGDASVWSVEKSLSYQRG